MALVAIAISQYSIDGGETSPNDQIQLKHAEAGSCSDDSNPCINNGQCAGGGRTGTCNFDDAWFNINTSDGEYGGTFNTLSDDSIGSDISFRVISQTYGTLNTDYTVESVNAMQFGETYPDDITFTAVAGCTDESAYNYDSDATYDDGSCEYEPVENVISDLSVDEGGSVSFQLTAIDPDFNFENPTNDSLLQEQVLYTFKITNNEGAPINELSFGALNHYQRLGSSNPDDVPSADDEYVITSTQFTYQSQAESGSPEQFYYTVTDPDGNESDPIGPVEIAITYTDEGPTISSIGIDNEYDEDFISASGTISATDPEGDEISYSVELTDGEGNPDDNGIITASITNVNTLNIYSIENQSGTQYIKVTATSSGGSDSVIHEINIEPVGDAPVLTYTLSTDDLGEEIVDGVEHNQFVWVRIAADDVDEGNQGNNTLGVDLEVNDTFTYGYIEDFFSINNFFRFKYLHTGDQNDVDEIEQIPVQWVDEAGANHGTLYVEIPIIEFEEGPVWTSIDDQSMDEDGDDVVINLVATDPEGGDVTYSVVENTNSNLITTIINDEADTLTLQATANEFGESTITIRATDDTGLYSDEQFTISVITQYDQSILLANNNQFWPVDFGANRPITVVEESDDGVEVIITATDNDVGDQVYLQNVVVFNAAGTIESDDSLPIDNIIGNPYTFKFIPGDDVEGTFDAEIRVEFTEVRSDGTFESHTPVFPISITAVDDGPSWNPEPPTIVEFDEDDGGEDITLLATDPDNDDSLIVYSIFSNSNPDVITASITNNVLSISNVSQKSGTGNVDVRATSNNKVVGKSIAVLVNPVQDGYTLYANGTSFPIADNTIQVGEASSDGVNIMISAFDLDPLDELILGGVELADSNDGTITEVNATDGDLIADPYQFNFTPNPDIEGPHDVGVNLIITPEHDNVPQQTVTPNFNIRIVAVNDSPILVPIDDQSTNEDVDLVIDVEATDTDTDALTWSAESTGENADNVEVSISSTGDKTAQLTVSPADNWSGVVGIKVEVSDGVLDDDDEFNLTVGAINDDPVLTYSPIFTIAEDAVDDIKVMSASDIDLDEVTWDLGNCDDNTYKNKKTCEDAGEIWHSSNCLRLEFEHMDNAGDNVWYTAEEYFDTFAINFTEYDCDTFFDFDFVGLARSRAVCDGGTNPIMCDTADGNTCNSSQLSGNPTDDYLNNKYSGRIACGEQKLTNTKPSSVLGKLGTNTFTGDTSSQQLLLSHIYGEPLSDAMIEETLTLSYSDGTFYNHTDHAISVTNTPQDSPIVNILNPTQYEVEGVEAVYYDFNIFDVDSSGTATPSISPVTAGNVKFESTDNQSVTFSTNTLFEDTVIFEPNQYFNGNYTITITATDDNANVGIGQVGDAIIPSEDLPTISYSIDDDTLPDEFDPNTDTYNIDEDSTGNQLVLIVDNPDIEEVTIDNIRLGTGLVNLNESFGQVYPSNDVDGRTHRQISFDASTDIQPDPSNGYLTNILWDTEHCKTWTNPTSFYDFGIDGTNLLFRGETEIDRQNFCNYSPGRPIDLYDAVYVDDYITETDVFFITRYWDDETQEWVQDDPRETDYITTITCCYETQDHQINVKIQDTIADSPVVALSGGTPSNVQEENNQEFDITVHDNDSIGTLTVSLSDYGPDENNEAQINLTDSEGNTTTGVAGQPTSIDYAMTSETIYVEIIHGRNQVGDVVVYFSADDDVSEPGTLELQYSVIAEDEGCTDEDAMNYDDDATVDDGSCRYILLRESDAAGATMEVISETTIDTLPSGVSLTVAENNELNIYLKPQIATVYQNTPMLISADYTNSDTNGTVYWNNTEPNHDETVVMTFQPPVYDDSAGPYQVPIILSHPNTDDTYEVTFAITVTDFEYKPVWEDLGDGDIITTIGVDGLLTIPEGSGDGLATVPEPIDILDGTFVTDLEDEVNLTITGFYKNNDGDFVQFFDGAANDGAPNYDGNATVDTSIVMISNGVLSFNFTGGPPTPADRYSPENPLEIKLIATDTAGEFNEAYFNIATYSPTAPQGNLLISPSSSFGISIDSFLLNASGNDTGIGPNGEITNPDNIGGWITENDITGENSENRIRFYTLEIFNSNQDTIFDTTYSYLGGYPDIDEIVQDGILFKAPEPGMYLVNLTVVDNSPSYISSTISREILVENIISINQTIRTMYRPFQGIDWQEIDSDDELNLIESSIQDDDKRPDLGCFYYSRNQIPRYEGGIDLWRTIIASNYETEEILEKYGNIYESIVQFSDTNQITPDVDVRSVQSADGFQSRLYRYYDEQLHMDEYIETSAPLEAQFYFYPREVGSTDITSIRDIEEFDNSQYDYFIGFVDWGDGSEMEFNDEPKKLGNDVLVKHTYEKSGIYEVTGWMFKYRPFGTLTGMIANTKFTVRININQDRDIESEFRVLGGEDYTFLPYNETTPVIGGISTQSTYYRTINRQLGYIGSGKCMGFEFMLEEGLTSGTFDGDGVFYSYEEYLENGAIADIDDVLIDCDTLLDVGGPWGMFSEVRAVCSDGRKVLVCDTGGIWCDPPSTGNTDLKYITGNKACLEQMYDIDFKNYYDRFNTELALSHMDDEKVGETLSAFTGSYSYQAQDERWYCAATEDEPLTFWDGYGSEVICHANTSCNYTWIPGDHNGPCDSVMIEAEQVLYDGSKYLKGGELGNHLGDVDLAQVRYFTTGSFQMHDFLGMGDVSGIPDNPQYWKNIIPEDLSIYAREGNNNYLATQILLNVILVISYALGQGVLDYNDIEYRLSTTSPPICEDPAGTCTAENCDVCPSFIKELYQSIGDDNEDISEYLESIVDELDMNNDGIPDVLDIVTGVNNYLLLKETYGDLINPNSTQQWLGTNEYGNTYYYPVLPRLKANGEFMDNDNLQNNNIPFGSYDSDGNPRVWDEDDELASITNSQLTGEFLDKSIIDLNFSEIDEGSLGDNSGNNNLGILISDYRIEFDESTQEPRRTTNVNESKLEFRKRRAF